MLKTINQAYWVDAALRMSDNSSVHRFTGQRGGRDDERVLATNSSSSTGDTHTPRIVGGLGSARSARELAGGYREARQGDRLVIGDEYLAFRDFSEEQT
ncbi:MAG: hypothetical protein U0736_21645 [Gemmataceae bacterium]